MRTGGWLLVALALTACAHAPPVTESLTLQAKRARVAALAGWDLRGRLAIDTGERAFQARFRWLQAPDSLLLTVRGVLGAGSFEINGNKDALTLRARGETWSLTDPETELSALFGWWMPVTSLDAWLLALPDERFAAETNLDANDQLATLDQRLWSLEFYDYRSYGEMPLPRTIEMRHGALRLKLTVDTWSPLERVSDATMRAVADGA